MASYINKSEMEKKMIMREYHSGDLEQVMDIADAAWQPIRKMSREALGDKISDLLNPAGDAVFYRQNRSAADPVG